MVIRLKLFTASGTRLGQLIRRVDFKS